MATNERSNCIVDMYIHNLRRRELSAHPPAGLSLTERPWVRGWYIQ